MHSALSTGLLALVFLASKKSALTHNPGRGLTLRHSEWSVSPAPSHITHNTHDSIIMISLLLPILFSATVSDQVPERHPYSYTYNVLDVPSNNNYEVNVNMRYLTRLIRDANAKLV